MSGNTTVDRAEMAKAASQIEEVSGKIHQTQQTLGSDVTSLMGRWQGNAAQAFLKAYSEFDAQFGKVQQELDNIHSKLVDTQKTYVNTEDEQTRAADAITAILNS